MSVDEGKPSCREPSFQTKPHTTIKINIMKRAEQNTLIAEFMDLTPISSYKDKYSVSLNHCTSSQDTPEEAMKGFGSIAKYHEAWEWLMPVIATIKDNDPDEKAVHLIDKIDQSLMQTNIKSTHESVVDFVVWHNKAYAEKFTDEPLIKK